MSSWDAVVDGHGKVGGRDLDDAHPADLVDRRGHRHEHGRRAEPVGEHIGVVQARRRPRRPDTGRRERRVELAERATEPGPELGVSMTAVIATARVAATLRSSIDAGVDEPSRSRSDRTADWVALSARSSRSRWLVISRLRASRSSVVTTSAISSSGMSRSRKRRMMCAVAICSVA